MRREGNRKSEKPEDLPSAMKEKLSGERLVPMKRPPAVVPLSYILISIVLWFSAACQTGEEYNYRNTESAGEIAFEHRVEAEYADGFRINYYKNYKLLEILNPFQDRVDTLRYALVPDSLTDAVYVEGAEVIEIPVRSMIATSTTQVALTSVLNKNDIITGMVGGKYVYHEGVRQRLKTGEITGFSEGEFNREQALALNPDLVMISGGQSSQFDNYRILMKSGIDILVNSEWLETHPLGKAEWIKVMGALLNKEEAANKHFEEVVRRYDALKSKVTDVRQKPVVFTNLPYKGSWYVPGGNSFHAVLLKDAGADYPWGNSGVAGGLQRDFEVMYEIGLTADVWLNPGEAQSRQDLLARDIRFRDFRSYQSGEIYNNNRRVAPGGGNDYWESGVVYPDMILADLIKIFHPDLVPDHTFHYYQKLE